MKDLKQKAENLIQKFYNKEIEEAFSRDYAVNEAKRCALICVDEIIKETMLHDKSIYDHGRTSYWRQVKKTYTR